MALGDYWVEPGMTSVRPCQGQFFQHSSGSNVFYDNFGYCTPSYQGVPTPLLTTDNTSTYIWIAALVVGGFLVWKYHKKLGF